MTSSVVVQSISGCLSHRRKTKVKTDQSNASYPEMSQSTANLIVQFASSFSHDETSSLKLAVTSYGSNLIYIVSCGQTLSGIAQAPHNTGRNGCGHTRLNLMLLYKCFSMVLSCSCMLYLMTTGSSIQTLVASYVLLYTGL